MMKTVPIYHFHDINEGPERIGTLYLSGDENPIVNVDITSFQFLNLFKTSCKTSISVSVEKSYERLEQITFKFYPERKKAVCQSCFEEIDLSIVVPVNVFRSHTGLHGANEMIFEHND